MTRDRAAESGILSDISKLETEDVGSEEELDREHLSDRTVEILEKFEGSSIAPYRPPRFEDDVPKHEVVDRLEDELETEITIVGINTTEGDDWTIRVGGEDIGTIGRRRSRSGYTVFEMDSTEFAEKILSQGHTGSNS